MTILTLEERWLYMSKFLINLFMNLYPPKQILSSNPDLLMLKKLTDLITSSKINTVSGMIENN